MIRLRMKSLNWKYILGELLLIFLGINLAIWFNDWDDSRKLDQNKKVAIQKIEEEIKSNLEEVIYAREKNRGIPGMILAYKDLNSQQHGGIVVTPEEMAIYQKKHPGFYRIKDSMPMENGRFRYAGDTFINLELAALSEIAWETTKDMGIANELGFDCLYELENMYNVQRLVVQEIHKSAEALQTSDIERLLRILDFIRQLDAQLEGDYNGVLENLDDCS